MVKWCNDKFSHVLSTVFSVYVPSISKIKKPITHMPLASKTHLVRNLVTTPHSVFYTRR